MIPNPQDNGGRRLTRCTPHCETCNLAPTCPHKAETKERQLNPCCGFWEPVPEPIRVGFNITPRLEPQMELSL